MCRSYGVEQIFVDSAETLGNVQLDLMEIDADYFAGSLHKWVFAPATVAFLYCKMMHQPRLLQLIDSQNHGRVLHLNVSGWGGGISVPCLLLLQLSSFSRKLPEALKQRGFEAAGKMPAEAWGADCGVAPELCGSRVMVGLPPDLGIQTKDDALALRTRLRNEFSIEVHTLTPPRELAGNFPVKGVTAHLRISHQIYNTWPEYLRLRHDINDLVEKSKE